MKFLCDNCKAKYQIGDDKVAGKTVRMKCRRCGHSITVSAKVTESSVSRPFPMDPGAAAGASGVTLPPGSDMVVEPERRAPPAPAPRAPARHDDDESTTIMQVPMALRPAPVRPIGGRPAAPPPPRPAAGVPAAPTRGAPPPRPITALRAPAGAPARDLRPAPAAAPAPYTPPEPQPAPAPPQGEGGVAAAFQRAVADPHATSATRMPPHEDWYVGVGGSPLGPVRVDVIREKATLGLVDGESLVWREGFDEWQPLKKFPELLEVVHTARMARLALTSSKTAAMKQEAPAPQPIGAFQPRLTSSGLAAAAGLASAAGGTRPAAAPTPNTTMPLPAYGDQQQVAAAAAIAAPAAPFASPAPPTGGAPLGVLSDPFAKPTDTPHTPQPGQAQNGSAAAALAPAPFALPVPVRAPSTSDISGLVQKPRRGIPPAAYALIVGAAAFGGVAAYFLFFKAPQQPQIVIVERQVAAPGGATANPSAAPADGTPVGDTNAAPSAKAVAGPTGGGHRTASGATTATPAAPGAPLDTSGFTNGVPGPSPGGPSSPAQGSGGQLSQTEIQGVVGQNQARVRRQCWEPALAGRAANGPTSARVAATITIGASGNVDSANASGADAFPGLAQCIAGRLKNMKFPASGGSTTVQVPFVFASQ